VAEGDEWPYRLDLTPFERTIRNAVIAELDRQQADKEDCCAHAATPNEDREPHACIDGYVNLDKLARAIGNAISPETRAPQAQSDDGQSR
jgi:hypothetical protein